jgi:RHS repeat-associated protein
MDALERTLSFQYDRLGRMIKKLLPGKEEEVVYKYDSLSGSENAKGQLVMLDDSAQRKEFSYNKRGQIKKETRTLRDINGDLEPIEYITQYKKDLLNRTSVIDYPKNYETDTDIRVCYRYNSMGEVSGVDVNPESSGNDCSDGNRQTIVSNIEYNEFKQMIHIIRGNGVNTNYEYDIKGRLTNLKTIRNNNGLTETLQDVDYSFKVNNSIEKVENNPVFLDSGTLVENHKTVYEYLYDGLNRLTNAEGSYQNNNPSPSEKASSSFRRGFQYAPNGNLIQKNIYSQSGTDIDESWNYFYNNHAVKLIQVSRGGGNAKSTSNRFEMNYDNVGNMIKQRDRGENKVKEMVYDSNNRIIKVKNPEAKGYEKTIGRYYYDDNGFRVRKIARREVEIDGDEIFREFETISPNMYFGVEKQNNENGYTIDGSRAVVNNIYIDGVRIAALSPVSKKSSDLNARYYLTDQVDSVKLVLDGDAEVVSRFEYYPYGDAWIEEQKGEGEHSPKYNSQELDKETNFYFYNARHYDPEISRFITPDTVIDGEEWDEDSGLLKTSDTQGWNRFVYVRGNPIRYKDPTGHLRTADGCATGLDNESAVGQSNLPDNSATSTAAVKSNVESALKVNNVTKKTSSDDLKNIRVLVEITSDKTSHQIALDIKDAERFIVNNKITGDDDTYEGALTKAKESGLIAGEKTKILKNKFFTDPTTDKSYKTDLKITAHVIVPKSMKGKKFTGTINIKAYMQKAKYTYKEGRQYIIPKSATEWKKMHEFTLNFGKNNKPSSIPTINTPVLENYHRNEEDLEGDIIREKASINITGGLK